MLEELNFVDDNKMQDEMNVEENNIEKISNENIQEVPENIDIQTLFEEKSSDLKVLTATATTDAEEGITFKNDGHIANALFSTSAQSFWNYQESVDGSSIAQMPRQSQNTSAPMKRLPGSSTAA